MNMPLIGFAMAVAALALPLPAQERTERWDVTQARGRTRDIDFTTTEGTWMSSDVTPDGAWVVFDLLGHIYRVRATGGDAECLTQNAGVSVNFQPRISPDGKMIAFISDRRGQTNLWTMNIDGSSPRPVVVDLNLRFAEPAWSADGGYILVTRSSLGGEGGGGGGIWMYHRDGGQGVELVGSASGVSGPAWPSMSRDGQYVYFRVNVGTTRDVVKGSVQLRRLEIASGEIIPITSGEANNQIRLSSGGAFAPEVSPDGRWLAFGRRIPNAKISYKGHEYGPRTALWLRDLETGAERLAMDPIEMDLAEGGASRALPGYAWTRDGRSIVIAQGGKLRRLDVASGGVTTIPFSARVHRTISEMAASKFPLSDSAFDAKFLRWHTMSPDKRHLAFQAVGHVFVMDLPNGKPRRVTSKTSEAFEYAPAWSPDGQWLAFTTFDDTARGHVWKVRVGGPAPQMASGAFDPSAAIGTPVRLTTQAGEYTHPIWSPDGSYLVVVRGAGATARGQGMMFNPWYDLVRLPANGGAATAITKVTRPSEADIYGGARRAIVQPAFGPGGRIYYLEEKLTPGATTGRGGRGGMVFTSVTPDGKDKRRLARFPFADEAAPSPDGAWIAFQEGDNIYLTAFPLAAEGQEVLIEKRRGRVPIRQVSLDGGLFARWRDANTLEFGSANKHYLYNVAEQRFDTTRISLTVPRNTPSGTVALTGARVVTLENRRVLENATVLVAGSRISCVGTCSTAGATVVDARGKTIIPGLIDMHAHHHREHRGMRPKHDFEVGSYLAFGITTNLDNSMWSQNIYPTAELIEAGEVLGPRTFTTGEPLYRGDAARQNELTSYEVAEHDIRRLQSWGSVSLKQYQQPRRDQRQWVSDIARKLGLRVTAEGGDLEYNLGMIMDGQTGWEHPMDYMPMYADASKFFGLANATYSVTLNVGTAVWNEEYWWAESEVWKNPKLQQWLPWRTLLPHSRRVMLRPKSDYSFPLLAQAAADIIAAGGNAAIGSHGQAHGIGPHWEVWSAASALGNHGALEMASMGGAKFLGMDTDLGSISRGKLADLVVLNSNPLDNIKSTADVKYVMKGGVLFDGNTLDELWPQKKKFGIYPWVDSTALRTDVRPTTYFDRRP